MRGLVAGGRFNRHRCDLRRRGRQLTDLVSLGKEGNEEEKRKEDQSIPSVAVGERGGEQQRRED